MLICQDYFTVFGVTEKIHLACDYHQSTLTSFDICASGFNKNGINTTYVLHIGPTLALIITLNENLTFLETDLKCIWTLKITILTCFLWVC